MKAKNKGAVSEVTSYNLLKCNEAKKLFQQGIIQLDKYNQPEKALVFLQQALKIYQLISYTSPYKSRQAKKMSDKATLCLVIFIANSKGWDLYSSCVIKLHLFLLVQDVNQDIRCWNGLATCLYWIGITFKSLGKYEASFQKFKESLKAARKYKDYLIELKALKEIGDFYLYRRSEYKLAEQSYIEALNIARQYEELFEAKCELLNDLGCICYEQSQYDQAINYHLQQLNLAKSIENTKLESKALLNLGNIYQRQGNYDPSITAYQNCLEITKCRNYFDLEAQCLSNLGNSFHLIGQEEKAIKHHQKSIELSIKNHDIHQEYRALVNLGSIYESLGQYQKAIECQEQSLSILNTHSKEYAQTLGNLGNIYNNLGKYDLAIEYHDKSLKIKLQIQDIIGQAISLMNLGICYHSKKEYPLAIQHHQQSLQKISQYKNNYVEQFKVLINLGNVYRSMENYQVAKDYYNQAISIRYKNCSLREELYLFSGLSRACYYLQEYKQALDYCQRQLDISKQIGEVKLEIDASLNLGFWYYKNNQLLESENILKKAICLHELLRNGLNYNDQVMLFDTQVDVYFLLQEVLVKQNKYSEALEIAERGRARAFIELLSKRFVTIPTKFDNQLPSLEKIKKISLDYNATIVEYSIIYSYALYIWVIQPSGEIIFRNIDLNPLLEDETSLREIAKKANQEIDNSSWTDARYYVKKLYEYLILPIQDVLPTDPESQVIFIPQHELYLVPFPALQDSTGKFLIEQHTISIAPSIQSLEFTQNQKQRIRSKVWEDKDSYIDALVVGNPTMPIIPFSKPPKQLGSLPHSQEEAEEIAALFKTEAIIGNHATKLHIIELLPKAKLIHLATHGECSLTDQSGIPGAIALAPSDKDSGFLTSSDILELELNAELVVLSGCNTGLGAIRNDGIVSLSYCLFFAGIPSVIGSLWEVNDNPTKLLMIDFYQNLQNKMNKAQALRQAMLTLIEQYRNCPKMWAAFTLIGEL